MSSAARGLTSSSAAAMAAVTKGLATTRSASAGRREFPLFPRQRRSKRARATASRSCSASPHSAAALMAARFAQRRASRPLLPADFPRNGAQADVEAGKVGARLAAAAATDRRRAGDRAKIHVRPGRVLARPHERRPRRASAAGARSTSTSRAPLRKKRLFVVIGIVDQGVAGVRRSGRSIGAEAPGPSASSRDERAITASIAENSAASGSSSEEGRESSSEFRLLFLLPGVVAILAPQHVEAAGEKGAGRGTFDAAARPQHRMRPRQFMGWGAEIHLGIVQDEVFRMDEVASKPQRGAGVGKCARAKKPSRMGLARSLSSRRARASSASATARRSSGPARALRRESGMFRKSLKDVSMICDTEAIWRFASVCWHDGNWQP